MSMEAGLAVGLHGSSSNRAAVTRPNLEYWLDSAANLS